MLMRIKSIKRILIITAIVALSGIALVSNAQSGRIISLSEAIRIALAENYGVQIARLQSDIAKRNNSSSFSARYPTLDLILADNNRLQEIDNPASFVNGTFQNIGVSGQLTLNWILFDGFRVRITEDRLKQMQFLAEGSEAIVLQNTIQAVMQSYYTALLERERLRALREAERLSEDRLRVEEDRKNLGAGTSFELEQARANLANDRRNVANQNQNYRQVLLSLQELLNIQPNIPIELNDALPQPPASPAYEIEALRERLAGRNPDLRNEYINYEILKRDYDLAKSEQLPAVNLNAGSGYTLNRIKLNSFEPRTGTTIDFFASFTLNWRILQGGAIRKQIENAAVQEQIGLLSIERARNALQTRLETSWQDYLTRFESWKASQEALQANRRVLEIAGERLRQGTITTLDFRNFQLQSIQSEFAALESQHRLLMAEVELLRLTGGIMR